jgi:hypothetical protein
MSSIQLALHRRFQEAGYWQEDVTLPKLNLYALSSDNRDRLHHVLCVSSDLP